MFRPYVIQVPLEALALQFFAQSQSGSNRLFVPQSRRLCNETQNTVGTLPAASQLRSCYLDWTWSKIRPNRPSKLEPLGQGFRTIFLRLRLEKCTATISGKGVRRGSKGRFQRYRHIATPETIIPNFHRPRSSSVRRSYLARKSTSCSWKINRQPWPAFWTVQRCSRVSPSANGRSTSAIENASPN